MWWSTWSQLTLCAVKCVFEKISLSTGHASITTGSPLHSTLSRAQLRGKPAAAVQHQLVTRQTAHSLSSCASLSRSSGPLGVAGQLPRARLGIVCPPPTCVTSAVRAVCSSFLFARPPPFATAANCWCWERMLVCWVELGCIDLWLLLCGSRVCLSSLPLLSLALHSRVERGVWRFVVPPGRGCSLLFSVDTRVVGSAGRVRSR